MEAKPLVVNKSSTLTGVPHGASLQKQTFVTPKTKTEAFQENVIIQLSELKDGLAQIQKILQEETEDWQSDPEGTEEEAPLEEAPLKKKGKTDKAKN